MATIDYQTGEVLLTEATRVKLDNRDNGEEVPLPALTVIKVNCTILPVVIQCTIMDGRYAGRTAFVLRGTDADPCISS